MAARRVAQTAPEAPLCRGRSLPAPGGAHDADQRPDLPDPGLRNQEVRGQTRGSGGQRVPCSSWGTGGAARRYLHNLLAQDEQFAHPNVWQALNPHTFLSTERYSAIMRLAAPKTRLIDNVAFAPSVPMRGRVRNVRNVCARRFVGWIFPRSSGPLRQVPHLPRCP